MRFFANSRYTMEDFLKYFPHLKEEQFRITYLASDKKSFYVDKDAAKNSKLREKYLISTSKYFFALHNVDPRKNVAFSTRVFCKWIKDRKERGLESDVIFVIGGAKNDHEIEKIFQSAQSVLENAKDHIKFIGYVDDADIPNLFTHCVASIYLSIYEGFGMPALEAMECGAPVIASSTTSLPEVVGDGGILVHPSDEVALYKALERIYEDDDFRLKLIENGKKWSTKFSWEESAKIILKFMQD